MQQQPTRLRRPPAERFAGTEHIYDVADIAAQLRVGPHPAKDGPRQVKAREGWHELDAGTLLALSPEVTHDLYAATPSQVLLTVHLEPKA